MEYTMFTVDDLRLLLRECAGEDEAADLDGQILDTEFEELGYDSLALFNTVSRIERDRAITLPDDVVSEAKTPRRLLDEINAAAGRPA
ncbi:acyl carrier protein [Amycolatopsis minnesotensis]|uniref:Acyl carrier protein n=1 Tax=Amycolatopsis minnesotensis TaxID=337894 RepID=A0ABN2RLL2_9PSEU